MRWGDICVPKCAKVLCECMTLFNRSGHFDGFSVHNLPNWEATVLTADSAVPWDMWICDKEYLSSHPRSLATALILSEVK